LLILTPVAANTAPDSTPADTTADTTPTVNTIAPNNDTATSNIPVPTGITPATAATTTTAPPAPIAKMFFCWPRIQKEMSKIKLTQAAT